MIMLIWVAISTLVRGILYFYQFDLHLPHFSSPYSSVLQLEEANSYSALSLSPYFEGSIVHIPPLLLYLLPSHKPFLFLLLSVQDLLISYFLFRLTRQKKFAILYLLFSSIEAAKLNINVSTILLLGFLYYSSQRRRLISSNILGLLIYIDPNYLPIASVWYFQHFTKLMYLQALISAFFLYILSYTLTGETIVIPT